MAVATTHRGILSQHATSSSRKKRSKRSFAVETLETRTLLSYTFAYSNPNDVTVNESGGSDSFNVIESGGDLEYSIDGGAFSADWGGPGNVVNASSLTSVFINLGSDDSAIILGNTSSAASNNLALFTLTPAAGNTSDSLTIDDNARSLSGGTYSVGTSPGLIVGPANGIDALVSTNLFGGGTTLEGNGASNTLNYVANGATPTVTSSAVGSVTISAPNFGALNTMSFDAINISDVPAPTIIPGASLAIDKNAGGLSYTNATVGTFTMPLGSIIPPPAGLPASDFTATINWGDGSPVSAGTVVQDAANPSVYDVTGTHAYSVSGTFTVTNTVAFSGGTISDQVGGSKVSVIFPPAGPTAGNAATIIADATLTGSTGITFKGTEGIATPATSLIGTFSDSDPSATVADFTTGSGSVVVNWGDGSAPQTLTAANLTANNSIDNTVFSIDASHTYSDEGDYPVTIAVTDTAGATTTVSSTAIIVDAALTPFNPQPTVTQVQPTEFPVPQFGAPAFTGAVATFSDAAGASGSAADFTATIDWGDGTSSIGTIGAGPTGSPVGTYTVSGAHTYAEMGTYPVQVLIVDTGGSRLTTATTATVTALPLSVTGVLDPSSDSGVSTGHANVTKVVQPAFTGTVVSTLPSGATEPEADARVTLTTAINGVTTTIGTGTTNSQGAWIITSTVALVPDGTYAISATATDQFGALTTTSTIVPSLVIDTAGPVITGAFFNHLNGQVDFTIQDPSPASGPPSGVWVNTLLNSANYLLTKVHPNKDYPGKWIVTNVTATPGASPYSYDVAVTFNNGKPIKGGFYLFTIHDSSNGSSSVQDIAENHLDGVFYGTFPSGNGINGSDFVAELDAYHAKVFAPQTIVGTASAANGGVGGPPVGAVHSGVFSPVVPRGGSPVFGARTAAAERRLAALKGHAGAKTDRAATAVKTHGLGKEAQIRAASHPHGPLHS
jgi:hypothetical protein